MKTCRWCGAQETKEKRWKPNQQCCGQICGAAWKKSTTEKKHRKYVKPTFSARGSEHLPQPYSANAIAEASPRKLIIPIPKDEQ